MNQKARVGVESKLRCYFYIHWSEVASLRGWHLSRDKPGCEPGNCGIESISGWSSSKCKCPVVEVCLRCSGTVCPEHVSKREDFRDSTRKIARGPNKLNLEATETIWDFKCGRKALESRLWFDLRFLMMSWTALWISIWQEQKKGSPLGQPRGVLQWPGLGQWL